MKSTVLEFGQTWGWVLARHWVENRPSRRSCGKRNSPICWRVRGEQQAAGTRSSTIWNGAASSSASGVCLTRWRRWQRVRPRHSPGHQTVPSSSAAQLSQSTSLRLSPVASLLYSCSSTKRFRKIFLQQTSSVASRNYTLALYPGYAIIL